MSLSLCFLFCLTSSSLVAVQARGFKILGGYVKEYSENSKEYYGESLKWGQSKADGHSEERKVESMFCWTRLRRKYGYCYHFLIVSTIDDPNEEHFQIIGSYQKIYDGSIVLETKYENGITEARPPYRKIKVANGKTWCQATNTYRYGNLFFFVNRTTQPSITDDISFINMKADNHDRHMEEQFWDYHDRTSVRILFNGVSKYTGTWAGNTYFHVYFWRAPTTLVDTQPLNDQANLISHNFVVKKTIVLRNEGSGVTSPNFPILGTTQTVTSTSESRFLRSWDFSFSVSSSVSFNVFAVSSEISMSASFSYHSEEELTHTNSVSTTVEMEWPNECPAGFRITYAVAEVVEEQELPIKLFFMRAGVIWTEIDMVRVILRKLVLTKNDCCLFNWADALCGSESLDMCVESQHSN